MSYLAGREMQNANWHGVFVQLNLLNDEHLSSIVNSLVHVTVFYQETTKQPFNTSVMSTSHNVPGTDVPSY